MAKSPLEVIFEFCDISQEHIDYARKTLYKYKDDPVVSLICTIINENADAVSRLNELFSEVGLDTYSLVYPLIIPSPNSPTELRVYPNIIIDDHTSLSGISTTYCQGQLKTFLKQYDEEMADEKKQQRWVPQDRAEKRLLEFIDMPTARALTRYIFTDGKLADHQIRDYAEAIDTNRKPLELVFCEKPEDYTTMYASGPHSCMAFNAQERANWEFMKAEGLCPTSWYHWNEYTSGVYATKGGKVTARTILFKRPEDKNWEWVRIYASNDEIRKKFIQSLAELGIKQCAKAAIDPDFSFIVPGIKKGAVWAAPWPYIDSPIPCGHTSGTPWNVSFNKDTHEFTFYFNDKKYISVVPRSGHIISSDYVTIECSSCKKVIKKGEMLDVRVDHEYHIFCSDMCAATEGFVKVVEGTGNMVYKQYTEDMVDCADGGPFVKFSTIKAAQDNGYHPKMDELSIFPEETDYRMTGNGSYIGDASRGIFRYIMSGFEQHSREDSIVGSKVPIKLNTPVKIVEYNEDRLYVEA